MFAKGRGCIAPAVLPALDSGETRCTMRSRLAFLERMSTLDLAIAAFAICAFAQTLGVAYVVAQVPLAEKCCQLLMWLGTALAGVSALRRRIDTRTWVVLPVAIVAFLLQRHANGGSVLLQGLVLVVAASGLDFKQVCRALLAGTLSAALVVLLLFLSGVSDAGVGRRNGISLGFGHPNTAGRVVLLCYLLWMCGCKSTTSIGWMQSFLIGAFLLVVTGSRTAVALILLMPFIVFATKGLSSKARVRFGTAIGLLPLALFILTYTTARMLPVSEFVNHLDLVLSNRIFLNYYAFGHNDLTLFGQVAQLSDHSGTIYNDVRNLHNWSVTVDSTYAVMLISYGIVPSLLFASCAFSACRRAGQTGDVIALAAALVLSIYAFNESQMISVISMFFFFYATARADLCSQGAGLKGLCGSRRASAFSKCGRNEVSA